MYLIYIYSAYLYKEEWLTAGQPFWKSELVNQKSQFRELIVLIAVQKINMAEFMGEFVVKSL